LPTSENAVSGAWQIDRGGLFAPGIAGQRGGVPPPIWRSSSADTSAFLGTDLQGSGLHGISVPARRFRGLSEGPVLRVAGCTLRRRRIEPTLKRVYRSRSGAGWGRVKGLATARFNWTLGHQRMRDASTRCRCNEALEALCGKVKMRSWSNMERRSARGDPGSIPGEQMAFVIVPFARPRCRDSNATATTP